MDRQAHGEKDDGRAKFGDELVEVFADALCHFEGELPDVDALGRMLDPSAVIVEEGPARGETARSPVAWLAELLAQAHRRRDARCGFFVELLDRSSVGSPTGARVRAVWEERVTRSGEVVARRRVECVMSLRRAGGAPRVMRLSLAEITPGTPREPRG